MLLAAIGPKNVALAAEIFDEWQPFLFHPELSELAFGAALAAGRAKRDPELGDLGIAVQTFLLVTEDAEVQAEALRTCVTTSRSTSAGWAPRARTSTTPVHPLRLRR